MATNADVSFHDLIKTLRFGVMADGEVRYGRWFGNIDVIYASLGKENVVAIRGDTGTLELSGKISIIQPVGGYTIGNQKWSVDFLGGFRAWDMRTTLDVDVTKRPTNPHSIDRGWPMRPPGCGSTGCPSRNFTSSSAATAAAEDHTGRGRRTRWWDTTCGRRSRSGRGTGTCS